MLNTHLAAQDRERKLLGPDYRDHGLVFQQPDGSPWRPDSISREFKRLMRQSGAAGGLEKVPSLKSHRSTAVTELHEAGVQLEVIAKITGQVNGEVTREHYLSVTAERTRRGFRGLSGQVSPGRVALRG
jgi:hypothetical protein